MRGAAAPGRKRLASCGVRRCFRTWQEQSAFSENKMCTLKPRLARRLALPELPLRSENKRKHYKREGEASAEPQKRREVGDTEKR